MQTKWLWRKKRCACAPHIAQLGKFLEAEEPIGRKMDFLVQEINREANTIGSKASDVAIAGKVIDIKAEVEKNQRADPEHRIMQLVNIGFNNLVNADRVIAVVSPESAPVKRIVQDGKAKGTLIDATHGRKTMSVIITDSDNVILSYLDLNKIAEKFSAEVRDAL